ncbi:unnamed protein product [Ectocarpus sp. CCAP 1310/34]|nr:unnamed protein product [Ectocarpus sp. CCAP 1310/34]
MGIRTHDFANSGFEFIPRPSERPAPLYVCHISPFRVLKKVFVIASLFSAVKGQWQLTEKGLAAETTS